MTDDLVERLRCTPSALAAEAAAEIARLRARPTWAQGVEAAAASLDESADTLEKEAPGSVTASTMARIYREKAAVIRALKEPADG